MTRKIIKIINKRIEYLKSIKDDDNGRENWRRECQERIDELELIKWDDKYM